MWTVTLSPIKPGGPYDLHVHFGDVVLKLADILFGDVWICSGQSNMVFTVKKVCQHYDI